jgi:Protein of unknown function (DUF1460)
LKYGAFFILFWAFSVSIADQDVLIFTEKSKLINPKSKFSDDIVTIGRSFLGTPYVGHTLEGKSVEQLVINLRQLDCLTFVENTFAICLANHQQNHENESKEAKFELFSQKIQEIRYRNGEIDGYGSRLHYFTEWLLQQERAGHLRLISDELGGVSLHKKISFMSKHPLSYVGLSDTFALNLVKNAESMLSQQTFSYLPKAAVRGIENEIEDGDLIVFMATKEGLDVTHEGFAVREKGRVYVLHASSEFGKVVFSKWPLADYLARNNGQSGIMVARWTIDN